MLFISLETCSDSIGKIFHAFWMRLFYLQLRSFYLRFIFFTYSGGTVSKKDQTQFPDRGNRKQKRPNLIFGQGETVSKKDQTDLFLP